MIISSTIIKPKNLFSDPLPVDKMDIIQGGDGPVQLQLLFRNCSLYGISKGQISSVKGFVEDFNGKQVEIKGMIPRVELIGAYKINGKILILPIKGQGRSNSTLVNLRFVINFRMQSVMKDDGEYMEIDKFKVKINPSR